MKDLFLNLNILACVMLLLISSFSLIVADEKKEEKTEVQLEMVDCMTCKGTAKIDCSNCIEGKMHCPERCIKLDLSKRTDKVSKPGFVHTTFVDQNGKLHKSSCGIGHVGELVNFDGRSFIHKGKCKPCKGTSLKACDKCNAVGTIACESCNATGKMPKKEYDEIIRKENEDRELTAFTLKDGTKIYGKFYAKSEKMVTIKDEVGEKIVVKISDLKSVPAKYKSLLIPDEK